MPVKKSDKEKETGKKVAAERTEKTEKVERVEKAATPAKSEKPERTEKKGSKSAATLVSYQPEFTKSVLDQPDAPTGPVYRYSDTDLQEFRDLITKKLEAAKKELVYLQGLITRKDEAGTDDTENKYMSMEDGSGSQEREQLNQMASRQIQFIDHLEKAMVRIENKTYGICRVTGKLIDKARLRAVPHATLSIEAKLAKSK
ncbi:TraR/DksA C4-type zinc finger protein [Chitinophaga sp. GbtcB8]|uniref:TraR/DksA family transcriptional regulator n=1 Tax=Chitinophaga sp. GbtcB8 TaxID=2824753 RepID=UPI0020C61A54|nr:TraR/DksA C4-type zinc finger protein [Chitinophaga sp. GbtcB8]